MSKLISVIIPSGRADRVFNTVKGLLNQTIDRSKYEIIIVTPKPGRMKNLKQFDVRLQGVDRLFSPGKMRNIGANVASGEILFFIDDDCLPPSDWLAGLMATLKRNKKIGAVGCRVVALEHSFWYHCADYALFSTYQYDINFFCNLGSAAIAVKREAFESVKGFDETLLASEDLDFSLKLVENGWLSYFEPRVEVRHDHRCNTLAKIIVKAYLFGYYSGIVVQERHIKNISWLARISVRLQSPLLYPLLIIPYGLAVTLLQLWEHRGTEPRLIYFIPFILMSRIAYQIGVWISICNQKRS